MSVAWVRKALGLEVRLDSSGGRARKGRRDLEASIDGQARLAMEKQ